MATNTDKKKLEIKFKKGMAVKFTVFSPKGATKGKGTVAALPPKDPGRGLNRLTVKDSDGREWRPFVSHVVAV